MFGHSGQFYHGIEYEVTDLRPGTVPEKPDATMYVKGQELNVTRYTCLSNKCEEFACDVYPQLINGRFFRCVLKISFSLYDVSVLVHRGWQRDFRRDVKNGEYVPCWFIHNNGTGLIDGDVTDYIVSGLFKSV